jgi:amino acid adenylation domain-containing protein
MSERNGSEIAVIGLAGRFPGAATIEELWRNLCAGVEALTVFGEDELRAAGIPEELLARPEYVRARGVLPGVELFDAPLFEITPREAEILDPQHRVFLECAWEALETAGYDPRRYDGAVGVFAGASFAIYFMHHILANPEVLAAVGENQALISGERDFLAGRVSYKLDLSGPSLSVQTACSTSLVAVHLACQMLLAGECDMALAGGVAVRLPQVAGHLWQEGGTLSKDGHCRAFDAAASGTVVGSGAGVVVLKPLDEALEEGDHIWAVIKGSAMNNDGAARVGFSAPGVEGQAKVIQAALGVAEVEPESIGYVEAHGSGTPLGDRIELAALHRAFADAAGRGRFCALGSVKPNIGHLDAAAGIASLIKTVLALHHKTLPPSLHYGTPNAELAREDSPFRVVTRREEWPAEDGEPRRAAVNSFGMGGTNAHVILEEAPEPEPASPARPWQVLPLSARTGSALDALAGRLADWLEAHPEAELADVAWTLQVGRRAFPHRRVVVCRDREEAMRGLRGAQAHPPKDPHPLAPSPTRTHARPGEGESEEDRLADLWLSGDDPDWEELHQGERRRRVPLPTYPFERQRYWIDPPRPAAAAVAAPAARPATHERPRLSTDYEAPQTEVERTLVEIWEEVFGISPVGIRDSFAELGGHSLLATQIQSRVRDRLGAALPLAAVLEAPTVAELARIVSPGAAEGASAAAERIPPRSAPADRFPVSFSQLRLWLLDRMEPGTPAYNIPMPLLLQGPLDRAVLDRCLAETVRRHESLRTVFALQGNEPVQVILPPAGFGLPLVDLTALAEEAREEETARLVDRETETGFDLARGPLLRAALVRHGAERHVLLLTVHHIVSDGWSLGVWFREIGALYEAFAAGRPSPLPALPIQYPDFAVWQRGHLQGERLEELLAYWREQLAGASPSLDLPADRPRPAVQSHRGAHEFLRLEPSLVESVRDLARAADATPFMVLLAAFQTLASRWSGQEDVSAGTFIAHRNRAEIEGLIGFFVNTLVLRTDLGNLGDRGGEPTFRGLLGRAREVTLGAYAHQDLPLERLIEELQPRRDPSRTPLFQVMLIFQNIPEMVLRLPDLTMSFLPLRLHRSNFDLSLWIDPAGGDFAVDAEYATALFDAATVRRFLGHFRTLLAAAAEAPDTPLARLPLMGEDERRQVLVEWNDTAAWLGAEVPVHLRIREQARRTPDAPAVLAGEAVLTYGELDRRAEALAGHLRGLGAGPEVIVGLALRRSPEMIAGLLGVLYAGAAYLPLDPDYPRERLELMLRDAGVSIVLTDDPPPDLTPPAPLSRLPPSPRERGELHVLSLSKIWGAEGRWRPSPGGRVGDGRGVGGEVGREGGTPAYVIFTSGSTGVPKGVVVTHGGLANHTASAIAEYGLGPGDRVLQFASINFDTSAEEIYPCLAAGAALVLRDDSMVTSAADFLRAVDRLGLTVLDLPTAYWHELAAGLERSGVPIPPSVRLVILGGEKALADRLAAWYQGGGGGARTRLVNTYGPTEGTIVATRTDLPPDLAALEPPIGRPIHNVRAYVLDRALEPAPVGVPGELCLAGAQLARGYLNRPETTAERFVPDPFGEAADRLYRTGDLVRWLPDGDLEFLGRVDRQVKIRGFRVEVGEVEKALRQHPGLADAVVEARQDGSGSLRLVAYVVPAAGAVPGDLRAGLRERLPEYMVPAAVVVLPELPRTPSGKIDRRALPAPESLRTEPDAAYVPPQSELERIIAGIWQEVLGVERVGSHDNFFELGGHSLQVVQVHGRLREALGREIDIILLFQRPTVSALARELRQGEEKPAFAEARALVLQQKSVNLRRKELMEQMMRQRRARG